MRQKRFLEGENWGSHRRKPPQTNDYAHVSHRGCQTYHKWPKISVTLCLHLYFPKRYSFIAFSFITIRARSSALSRVISPSFIMPVSANASASRPVAAFAYPLSSH